MITNRAQYALSIAALMAALLLLWGTAGCASWQSKVRAGVDTATTFVTASESLVDTHFERTCSVEAALCKSSGATNASQCPKFVKCATQYRTARAALTAVKAAAVATLLSVEAVDENKALSYLRKLAELVKHAEQTLRAMGVLK